jgi:uncharacterized membrane protein YphA (DoxX/SURF4 family)
MSVDTMTPPGKRLGRGKTIALWVASGLLAALFVLSGSMKFVNAEEAEKLFAKSGYPDWFRVLIGVIEIGGGLALLIPRTTFYAAAALAVVMAGAVFTHLRQGEIPQSAVPFVLLLVLVVIAYTRLPRSAS